MIRIGTRASKLAITQAEIIATRIQEEFGYRTEIVPLSSKGDFDQVSKLTSFRGQGLFTSHLEAALAVGQIDIAVHSLKDLPVEISPKLPLRVYLKRHSPGDTLLIKKSALHTRNPLQFTRPLRFATGSPRRQAQLIQHFHDAIPVDIRGNVHTRLKKLQTPAIDALIMATAVFDRIDLPIPENIEQISLDPKEYPPAPGQAVIAVQCRQSEFAELAKLNHEDTKIAAEMERRLLLYMGGGCDLSFGAYIYREAGIWNLIASFASVGWYAGKELQMSKFHYQAETVETVIEQFKQDVAPVTPTEDLDLPSIKGKTILIARNGESSTQYLNACKNIGLFPLPISISEYHIDWQQLYNQDLIDSWNNSSWVVISSQKAVSFLSLLSKLHPHPVKIATVGTQTAAALRAEDFPVHIIADGSMASLQKYLETMRKEDESVVYFHGEKFTSFPTTDAQSYPVYTVSYRAVELPLIPDFLLVFSKASADFLLQQLGSDCTKTWITIGPSTAKAFDGSPSTVLIASSPSAEGVIQTLKETYR